MMRALRIFGRSFVQFYDELFLLVGINLVWAIGSFIVAVALLFALRWPLVMVMGANAAAILTTWPVTLFPFMGLLMLAPNPLTAGVFFVTRRIALEKRVYFHYFWAGIKRYWVRSWVLLATGIVGYLVLLANLRFYMGMTSFWKSLSVLWLYALIIWSCMQLYTIPLLLEQRDKSPVLIVRNAFLLTMSDPIFTIPLVLLIVILVLIGALLPFILLCFLACLVSLICNAALVERLRLIGTEPAIDEEEELL